MRAGHAVTGAVLLMIGACGSDGSGPGGGGNGAGSGSFQGTISGATNDNLSGTATFAVATGLGFTLSLGDQGAQVIVQVLRPQAVRPATGTYTLDNLATFTSGSVASNPFAATGGTLTVTTSTDSQFEGTLQFDATTVSPAGSVTVSVTFSASCTPGGGATCS